MTILALDRLGDCIPNTGERSRDFVGAIDRLVSALAVETSSPVNARTHVSKAKLVSRLAMQVAEGVVRFCTEVRGPIRRCNSWTRELVACPYGRTTSSATFSVRVSLKTPLIVSSATATSGGRPHFLH